MVTMEMLTYVLLERVTSRGVGYYGAVNICAVRKANMYGLVLAFELLQV